MKTIRQQQVPETGAVFVPHAFSENAEPQAEPPPPPLAGYLKWFAERPEHDPAHAEARGLIAEEFNLHMAALPSGHAADFGDMLVESLSGLLHTTLRNRLTFNLRLCAQVVIGPFQAHTLAFVMSEIVLYAVKHAHPDGGRISMEIDCLPGPDGETRLAVSDDGVGLPPGFAEWSDGGEGLMRIRYALQQMGASLNLESDDLGLRFAVELPAPAGTAVSRDRLPKILSPYSAHYLNDADNPHAYTPD